MNAQREHFKGQVAEHMKVQAGGGDHNMDEGGDGHTHIEHHEPGKTPEGAPEGTMHTIHHPDGEVSHHPNMGHAAMYLASKHDGGEHGHIHAHGAGATTHHVGIDGEVQGPHEHESEDEAFNHLKSSIGENAGMEHAEPDGDEAPSGGESYL